MSRPPNFSIQDVMKLAATKVDIDGWQAHTWSAADGGSIVKGCVPSGVYTRGPRKGQPKFRPAKPNSERVVVIGNSEMEAHALSQEAATGKCWECGGTGQEWAGWDATTGTLYRPCRRCNATGHAPKDTP